MRPADFDYCLPPDLIAQHPLPQRDSSRLLVLNRNNQELTHARFLDLLTLVDKKDLLIFNNSKVFPARVRGIRLPTGGQIELLLLEETEQNVWWCLARPASKLNPGTIINIVNLDRNGSNWTATLIRKNEQGQCQLCFRHTSLPERRLLDSLEPDRIGEVPLPPYIKRLKPDEQDSERYQTVFATQLGSIAAPTAGLHFTPLCLTGLRKQGVSFAFVTLHVGLGTFAPMKAAEFSNHIMHEESFSLSLETVEAIEETKRRGGRVIAVGTTTLRVLESAARDSSQPLNACSGKTRLFVHPPFHFKIVDALITNFHLPKSTLLALVCAFATPNSEKGRDLVLRAYQEAVERKYRFFSYGDAMFIL